MKRVAILIETSRSYPRDVLIGIRRFVAASGNWAISFTRHGPGEAVPSWLDSWAGDGILVQTFSEAVAAKIEELKIPAVELRSRRHAKSRPFVGCDNRRVGRLAAQHFMDRGYRHFASLTVTTSEFFVERTRNFAEVVKEAGYPHGALPPLTSERPDDWGEAREQLGAALRELARPLAVFAANDLAAALVLEACRHARLAVPDEVAILGAENDETLCHFSVPELSSVKFDGERVGFEAARLLDSWMKTGRASTRSLLIPPLGIVTRGSSDDLAVRDPLVIKAMRLIREGLASGITTAELAGVLGCSRSTLQRRIQAATGRGPGQEIMRWRDLRVKELLTHTDLTLEAIAPQVGVAQVTHLYAAFREKNGMTPRQYRERNRHSSGF